jgi:hypothetical protein
MIMSLSFLFYAIYSSSTTFRTPEFKAGDYIIREESSLREFDTKGRIEQVTTVGQEKYKTRTWFATSWSQVSPDIFEFPSKDKLYRKATPEEIIAAGIVTEDSQNNVLSVTTDDQKASAVQTNQTQPITTPILKSSRKYKVGDYVVEVPKTKKDGKEEPCCNIYIILNTDEKLNSYELVKVDKFGSYDDTDLRWNFSFEQLEAPEAFYLLTDMKFEPKPAYRKGECIRRKDRKAEGFDYILKGQTTYRIVDVSEKTYLVRENLYDLVSDQNGVTEELRSWIDTGDFELVDSKVCKTQKKRPRNLD